MDHLVLILQERIPFFREIKKKGRAEYIKFNQFKIPDDMY